MDRQFPFADPVPGHMPMLALRRFAEEHGMARQISDGSAVSLEPEVRTLLAATFADPGRSPTLAPQLYHLMERLRAEFQDQASPTRTIQLLEKLRTTLAHLEPQRLTPEQRLHIRSETAAIQAQVGVLLDDGASPVATEPVKARIRRLLGGR